MSVRWLDAEGQARDLVGEVLDAGPPTVRVLPWDRGPVDVPVEAVVAWREVPPKAVRPSSTPADLARLAARGWPGLEVERLGGWELRAAGGYTRRANSALCEGDPGVDTATAIDRVTDFYRSRGLPPQVALAARPGERHSVEEPLARGGWRIHTPTWMMTLDLRASRPAALQTASSLSWSDRPDAAWLAAFGRPHPLRLAVLTASAADYVSLGIGGDLTGIGRLSLTADWAGISGLWVSAGHRGQGLGTGLLAAMVERALDRGARFGYLQVMADNPRARALYERLGWRVHHRYVYAILE